MQPVSPHCRSLVENPYESICRWVVTPLFLISHRSLATTRCDMEDNLLCGENESGEFSLENDIVSAARAHAASIRWTLWLKEYKRANGRSFVASDSKTNRTGRGKLRGRDSQTPATINGSLYTPEYWRAWQRRSKAKACKRNEKNGREVGCASAVLPSQKTSREGNDMIYDMGSRTTDIFRQQCMVEV